LVWGAFMMPSTHATSHRATNHLHKFRGEHSK